jgi:general secretion pathway protein N
VVDSLRPLTLLLGGAALWALCLLVLALAGLGTRFPAPDGSVAPPPLPKVSLVPTRSRLGAWESYAEVGARPLLNERRQPVAVAMEAAGGTDELDVTLSSVLITSRLKVAILTDNKEGTSRRVRLGEQVEGSNWRLVSLEPRRAVLEGPTGQRTLELRVYDGQSGLAPTPIGVATSEASPPPPPRVVPSPAPATTPAPVPANAAPVATADKPDPNQMSQEEQVEAIRRRIEARRAQMRAEAEAASAQNR